MLVSLLLRFDYETIEVFLVGSQYMVVRTTFVALDFVCDSQQPAVARCHHHLYCGGDSG